MYSAEKRKISHLARIQEVLVMNRVGPSLHGPVELGGHGAWQGERQVHGTNRIAQLSLYSTWAFNINVDKGTLITFQGRCLIKGEYNFLFVSNQHVIMACIKSYGETLKIVHRFSFLGKIMFK